MNGEDVLELFNARGGGAYHGEAVTQREHALQAAALAESEGATDALIVAALLHDVGHLLSGFAEDGADAGLDDRHEYAGASWLAEHFGPEVVEPIRLHVDAKRYLCATDPAYERGLSAASMASLALQGGPMTAAEAARFEANPRSADALRLRRWDDAAKVPGLFVPDLDHYEGRVAAVLRRGARS